MAAAEAMLDKTHPSILTNSADNNTYVLGEIFGHNVVISCLRSGVYGTTSAAISAVELQSTYKCIRLFLLVGIGGGAPSAKADIRLGDVVVSKPTREFGGVIQYDYGKTTAGGYFERTGVLNKPSSVLLTAVSRLESAHRLSPPKLPELMAEALQRHPKMTEKFTYRGKNQDQLFDAAYVHSDPDGTCARCDSSRLVIRPSRLGTEPVVHYGLVASANQVLKDAIARDRLSRQLGILCFEMEAAGLMDDLQCLVIRGICDYSDSHKNKQWQEYAAMAAAAYAKELISVVHTVQGHHTQQTLSNEKESVGSGKTIIATSAVEAARYRYPDVRSPTIFFYCENDYGETLKAAYILSSFIRQLCEHLYEETRSYPEDIELEIRRLFGGKRIVPGIGDLQNTLAMLLQHFPNTFLIIDGLDALDQAQSKALLMCLKALCSSKLSGPLRILLFSRNQIQGYLNIATFMPGVRQISTSCNVRSDIEIYINTSIADKTLYRNITDNPILLEDIKQTLLTESSEMFLWVYLQMEILWDTCYTDAEIRKALATLPKGLEETYARCVDRISSSDKYAMKVLKWVAFAIRPLHVEEMREAVVLNLEQTQWNDGIFPQKDVLIGCCANLVVVDSSDTCVRFAHSSVKRYLEHCLGGEVNSEQPGFDYPTAEQGNLECGELCITYLSFLDFGLQLATGSTRAGTVPVSSPALYAQQAISGHSRIARFLFSRFAGQSCDISSLVRLMRTESSPDRTRYKFLDYAVANWALHTKQIQSMSATWERFQTLATSFNETWNFHPWLTGGRSRDSLIHGLFSWAVSEQHEPLLALAIRAGSTAHNIWDLPLVGESIPALHSACKRGHVGIVRFLLQICDTTLADADGYTALHHAAQEGHIDVCDLLLSTKRVKVDTLSTSKSTPLWLAAGNGHYEIVVLLCDHGSNLNIGAGSKLGPPLVAAIWQGHLLIVKELLDRGASTDSTLDILDDAVYFGHETIVELLLDRGVRTRHRHQRGDSRETSLLTSLLLKAVDGGHEGIVRLLLNRGARIDLPFYDTDTTALHHAVKIGNKEVVQALLDSGAPIDIKNSDGQTPLTTAANIGRNEIVKLLLEKGASLRVRDASLSPFHGAAAHGYTTVLETLLDGSNRMPKTPSLDELLITAAKVDFVQNWQNSKGWVSKKSYPMDEENALDLRVQAGSPTEVVSFLLDRGADLNSKNSLGQNVLWLATRAGNAAVVALLLDRGADPDNTNQKTPGLLHVAIECRHDAVIETLLDGGASLHTVDDLGRTPLAIAVTLGNEAIVTLLLGRGAYVNTKDRYGKTPLDVVKAAKYKHKKTIERLLLAAGATR
ncbi:ankyrin repeat-containing domain protein [Aspergillus karnatakaensis]|uniref:ankyrin repeat-containing domain protein n=1 Tax=Aspergillus karnatakaensis TaxID=1810916 RepID=UPI003CCD1E88